MEGITCVLVGIVTGIKDSIWGIKSFRRVNKSREIRPNTKQVTTTLSRRRQRQEVNLNAQAKPEETKLIIMMAECCILNGVIMCASIAAFKYLVVPLIYSSLVLLFGQRVSSWEWINPVLHHLFETLWVLPLYLISRLINSFWFQDIADTAYKNLRGRPQPVPSISNWIADNIFSCVIQVLFLTQSFLIMHLPIVGCSSIGWCVSFVHMCLLHSFYAFEYKWINMGWGLHKRLSFIETNWPYFIGFGLVLTIVTQLIPSIVVSGGVFAILFPLFIVSANEARPLTDTCEYPMKLFKIVVYISNRMSSFIVPSNRKHRNFWQRQ